MIAVAKPFLKWAGGKRKLAKDLAPQVTDYLDTTGGTYFEPFLGAGAMALHLGRDSMVLSDAIPDLINLFYQVRDGPGSLMVALKTMRDAGEDVYSLEDGEPV